MMMASLAARVVTQGILQATLVIEYFMDKSLIEKSFKCAVNGYPVQGVTDLVFDITVRQGVFFLQKQMEYLLPGGGGPELEIL